jgi:hypothetical protein
MYAQVEKSNKKNTSRTIANNILPQTGNGPGTLEFVDNRPEAIVQENLINYLSKGPLSTSVTQKCRTSGNISVVQRAVVGIGNSVYQRQPVENIGSGDLQNSAPLEKQTGPSCWLFVLDAIFKEFGNAGYELKTAKYFYPDSDELAERKRTVDPNKGRRQIALELIYYKISSLQRRLKRLVSSTVTKEVFRELARRDAGSQNQDAVTDAIFAQRAIMERNAIIEDLEGSKIAAKNLLERLNDNSEPGKKDDEKMFGGSRFDLSGGGHMTVKRAKWLFKFGGGKLPMYMFLNTRFKARQEDDLQQAELDWTTRNPDDIQTSGHHAVMLVGINYGTSGAQYLESWQTFDESDDANYDDGDVTYKDPNYGDVKLKIKWSHLKVMMIKGGAGAYFGISSHD